MITIDFRKTYKNGELIVAHDEEENVFPMLKRKYGRNKERWLYIIEEFSLVTSRTYSDELVLQSYKDDAFLEEGDYWDHP